MNEALAAVLAGTAIVVIAKDAGAVADLRKAAHDAGTVLLVLDDTVPKLDRAMLIAALGPLAMDFAPATRLVALDLVEGADPDDTLSAAKFLASAASTTGQVLRIAPR